MRQKFFNFFPRRRFYPRKPFSGGFTLLEMIVSIGIFSVLVVTAIGISLNISRSQIKASNLRAVQDNIRFGMELMIKEIRTGINYRTVEDCGNDAYAGMAFYNSSGERMVYYLDNASKRIMRIRDAGDPIECDKAVAFTSEEINVDRLFFRATGLAEGAEDGQPAVTVFLKASAKNPVFGTETTMNLQTTVTQRLRDF